MDSSICLRSFSYHENSHTSLLPTCRFTGSGRCSAPYWQGCPMTSSLHAVPLVRSWWPVWPVRTSRSWRRQAWPDRRCLQSRRMPWEPSRPASRKTTEETCTKKAHSVQQRFFKRCTGVHTIKVNGDGDKRKERRCVKGCNLSHMTCCNIQKQTGVLDHLEFNVI